MFLIVEKTNGLNGSAVLPSSKSQNVRALLFALLAEGRTILENVLESEDTRDAIRVCESLGAKINQRRDILILESEGIPLIETTQHVHSGNSGITTRFILPALGYRKNLDIPIFLDCGEQMRARPIHSLVDALNDLGLTIEYRGKEHHFPLSVKGRLKGGKAVVDGLTSQYLSALLISLPCAEKDSEIIVRNLHERPYVKMTLQGLKEQKINYHHRIEGEYDIFNIIGNQRYHPFQKTIAGDFSSASYLMAAAVLMGEHVELLGLDMQDPQGDKRLVSILQEMGADIAVQSNRLIIRGGKPLKGMRIDANDIPDLLPTLAVIGTRAFGKTEITHVKQARIKETDRIRSMTEGLTRMGAKIIENEEGMTVYQSRLKGSKVEGYGDHRTVMALALAGMTADKTTVITEAESIDKTFPTFVDVMRGLGAKMKFQRTERE